MRGLEWKTDFLIGKDETIVWQNCCFASGFSTYSMIHLVRNILWELFLSMEAVTVLVFGSFCRYVLCIYVYIRFDILGQYFTALRLTNYQVSKAKNSAKSPGGPMGSIWILWIIISRAMQYCVWATGRWIHTTHVTLNRPINSNRNIHI